MKPERAPRLAEMAIIARNQTQAEQLAAQWPGVRIILNRPVPFK